MDFKVREPSSNLKRRKSVTSDTSDSEFLQDRVESILTENSYKTIQFISVDNLISFKNQKRQYFDGEKLKSLAKTIKEHGIRQPLTVIQSEDKLDVFEIVSGERRFLAAKMIGLDKVPCIIIHDRNAAEEIAVIENVQRADLHPIELGRAYSGLLENKVVSSQDELANKIGVPRTQVSEYVTFANFPKNIAEQLIWNGISARSVLRKISKCSDIKEMECVLDKAIHKIADNYKKNIAVFSIENSEVDMKIYNDLNLSNEELNKLASKVEDFLKSINSKMLC
jgi:ParB family chromosome partitioning protein